MKTKKTTGKNFDELQVNCMVEIINLQKQSKQLTREEFYSFLFNSFLNNFEENKFYKKTPRVFLTLTVFFVQLGKALKICYPDLKTTAFDLCHYLRGEVMFNPLIYKTKYTAFDADASEASRILKQTGIFN